MKGNLFLGHGRGAVGDVVFTRMNGQQIARARNRQPHDRKSYSQEGIRAAFSAAAKFFSFLPSNLLRYAFEHKGPRSSDYNQFIKLNVSKACQLTQEQFSDPDWFPFGEFQMSDGSLSQIEISNGGDELLIFFPGDYESGIDFANFGEFCAELIAHGGYHAGDIVTIGYVVLGLTEEEIDELEFLQPCPDKRFFADQWIIDPSDTRTFDELGSLGAYTRRKYIDWTVDSENPRYPREGYAVFAIHSRKVAAGLLSSFSKLAWSPRVFDKAIDVMQTETYEREVQRARGARENGILEGGLYD